jgi:hypothetical protein
VAGQRWVAAGTIPGKIQSCILISWSWLVGSMVFGLPFCPKGCGPQVDLDPDPDPDVEIAL